MVELMVTKRTGEVVVFDKTKIKIAIEKAIRATGNKLPPEKIIELVEHVEKEVGERFLDFYPNVENIQDIVEKNLVKEGLYEIAKAYILYRAERQKEREKKREENLEKAKLGRFRVKKEDGTIVLLDFNKIRDSIVAAADGFRDEISVDLISKEVVKNIYDGVTTEEISRALVLSAISFIEKDPAYSYVAGRLFLKRLFKEVTGVGMYGRDINEIYRKSFIEGIKKGVEEGVLDERMLDYDLRKLSEGMRLERDEILQYMGIETLYDRYFLKLDSKRIELPQAFWMRVAMGLALVEKDKNGKAIEFYDLLSSLKFVSSSPTLFNSGTAHPQLSSCYLNTVIDDLHHIFKVYGDNAQLSKWSGGIGTDWSYLRAIGSPIKSNRIQSQGIVPFLKISNDVTVAISRSGRKRGATCVYLETWHYEIEEFLDLRKNTGDERRRIHDTNTANWIPDLFMKRVMEGGEWTLFSPEEVPDLHDLYGKAFEQRYKFYEEKAKNGGIKLYKIVSAAKLWRKMLSMLFETGHPWITFKDPCNIRSPQDHVGVIHNSNLCTEITLNTSKEETAVCNLGSINLQKHIVNGKIDEEMLAQTIKTAVRMLDNVIDICFYPTIEAENSNMKHRPIGLGIMAFQDALYMLDIPFESERAIEFADANMEMISYYAILASSEIAREKGAYSTFKGSKWDRNIFPLDSLKMLEEERGMKIDLPKYETMNWQKVREHVKNFGMRNSNVMAIAPTATIANISGCYPCIEPIFKNIYVKANITGEFTVVNPYLIIDLKKEGLWNEEMLQQLKYYDGNIEMIAGIPDKIKKKYKTTFEIDPFTLVKITAARGKWIDQSQSFNVFLKGTSGKVISDVYFYAWQMGLKTTYYLRSMAASQIEKATLDASKYGFTQKRKYEEVVKKEEESKKMPLQFVAPTMNGNSANKIDYNNAPKLCKIDDPDCEACQ